jgi:PAS domain S-box-containing protein
MDFESMSKEELVEKLRELEEQRAFTYEDRMKLVILDESPFTIWASDRDCKITIWEGQCEALYGYSRDHALGKDYIPLFVAPDEQAQARADQLKIIDGNEVFHNIANDVAKNHNTLQLVTNCHRIKDPVTGKYWNAEMGLIIDYLEEEKDRLKRIVDEGRKVKNCTTQFISDANQRKEQFQKRKKAIREAITESQRKVISSGKRSDFRDKVKHIIELIDNLQHDLYKLIDDYYQKMQSCIDAGSCETVRLNFNGEYDEKLLVFEEILIDFEELNSQFNEDNSTFQLRDTILKDISSRNIRLGNLAFDMLNKANEEISDYRKIGDVKSDSSRLAALTSCRDKIKSIKDKIDNIADGFMTSVVNADDGVILTSLRADMENQYTEIERQITLIKRETEG